MAVLTLLLLIAGTIVIGRPPGRTMVLGVILLLNGPTLSGQTILYVDASATGPGHDGSSWCTAFTELHEALSVVTAGSVIRVADGVYRADATGLADPREATLTLSSGVTIEGGYAGCGAPDPDQRDIEQNETILSGDLLANDGDIDDYRGCCNSTFLPGCPNEVCAAAVCAEQSLCCDIQWQTSCAELAATLCSNLCALKDDNAYHVVTASGTDATAVVDGITITAGFANVTTPVEKSFGAGMYMQGGSPTVKNTVFRQNDATIHGAGLYVNVGSPTVTGCLFEDNRAAGYHPDRVARGGGAYVHGGDPVFIDCTFTNNWGAPFAGGIYLIECGGVVRNCRVVDNVGTSLQCNRSNPQITDCIFARNGGGIGCSPFSSPTIRNCFILGNFGPGVSCSVSSNPQITNCVIAGNFSGGSGGGINCLWCSAVITNCTIVGNSTFGDGGGIRVDGGEAPTIENCILWGNTAQGEGPAAYIGDVGTFPSSLTISFSNVQGGQDAIAGPGTLHWGEGNIDRDPQFIDSEGPDGTLGTDDDNLHLLSDSPCIDAGNNGALPGNITSDLEGNPRFLDGNNDGSKIVDMGAYEASGPIPAASPLGLALLTVLLLGLGAIVIHRRTRKTV